MNTSTAARTKDDPSAFRAPHESRDPEDIDIQKYASFGQDCPFNIKKDADDLTRHLNFFLHTMKTDGYYDADLDREMSHWESRCATVLKDGRAAYVEFVVDEYPADDRINEITRLDARIRSAQEKCQDMDIPFTQSYYPKEEAGRVEAAMTGRIRRALASLAGYRQIPMTMRQIAILALDKDASGEQRIAWLKACLSTHAEFVRQETPAAEQNEALAKIEDRIRYALKKERDRLMGQGRVNELCDCALAALDDIGLSDPQMAVRKPSNKQKGMRP